MIKITNLMHFLSHGLKENTTRVIKLTIPISEIPFVMRGLGFYPTEQEVDINSSQHINAENKSLSKLDRGHVE